MELRLAFEEQRASLASSAAAFVENTQQACGEMQRELEILSAQIELEFPALIVQFGDVVKAAAREEGVYDEVFHDEVDQTVKQAVASLGGPKFIN